MSRRAVSVVVVSVFAAVLISFLVYTHQMERMLHRDAEVFSRVYANAFLATMTEEQERVDEALSGILEESRRLRMPIVLTDETGRPTSAANLPFDFDLSDRDDAARVEEYVAEMDRRIPPIDLPEYDVTIHFGEPRFLSQLRWVPWLQAVVLVGTVAVGGWLVYTSIQGERDRIWSAMARESAHQMGTPLSSLAGWLEQMEERFPGEDMSELRSEMKVDVNRLLKVSRRFELIGRSPTLSPVRVRNVVERLERYFSARLPSLGARVRFRMHIPSDTPAVRGNETLLEWALENLIKNSLDALAGTEGEVGIEYAGTDDGRAVFRVWDTGPGVEPEMRKRIFDIGASTKETGWGVGLSLTRRIVEDAHGGSIRLEQDRGDGASFRLELPVAEEGREREGA